MKKLPFFVVVMLLLSSCGNNHRNASELEITNNNRNATYNGKNYTGTTEVTKGNRKATIEYKDGQAVSATQKYQNGYSSTEYVDGSYEYRDNNGNRISKDEYMDGIR